MKFHCFELFKINLFVNETKMNSLMIKGTVHKEDRYHKPLDTKQQRNKDT